MNGDSHDNTQSNQEAGATPISAEERAEALAYIIPPHSACFANEGREAYYTLYDNCIAKYRPADEAEHAIVREITDYQWKWLRDNQMESAFFNRELIRQRKKIKEGSIPELYGIEISMAAQEALTGNKTIAELRRDAVRCLRAIALLQRRLKELQKTWPQAAPVPRAPERTEHQTAERAEPEEQAASRSNFERPAKTHDINGSATESAANLHRDIASAREAEVISAQAAQARHQRARNSPIPPCRSESVVREFLKSHTRDAA